MTALVTKHLPLVAVAPDGIKKLRALILELAVRGRLVKQNTSDEAANVLLERIAAHRGKQSKAIKPISLLSDEGGVYPLPIGWVWTRLLSQVIESGAGWSPSCEPRARVGSEWGVLKVSAVSWGEFCPDENKALPARFEPRPEHEVAVGDFLISRANTAELVARSVVVNEAPPRLMLSDKIVRLKLTPHCNARYLNIVNGSPKARGYYAAVAGGTSSSMKNVSREQILNLPLPLPPLAEQHRIVVKVDELMALCDRLEADQADAEAAHAQLVQALLDSLTQATDAADFRASWQRLSEHFHTLFTTEVSVDALKQTVLQLAVMGKLSEQSDADMAEPSRGDSYRDEARRRKAQATYPLVETDQQAFSIPDGWQWKRLGECAEQITDGEHLTPPRVQNPDAIPLVTAKNVRDGYMDYASTDFVERSVAEKCWQRCKPEVGDILMVSVGATLGRLTVLREAREMVIVRSVALIKPSLLSADFMALTLRSPLIQRAIWASVKQSAQPCLYLKPASLLPVPVPPLPEQHRIVAKVDELMALCDQVKAQLAEARQQHAQLAAVLVEQAVA